MFTVTRIPNDINANLFGKLSFTGSCEHLNRLAFYVMEKDKKPQIVLVNYGDVEILMHRCFRCAKRFMPNECNDLFCDTCKDVGKRNYWLNKRTDYGVGIQVEIEKEPLYSPKRSGKNYNLVRKRDKNVCQYCGYKKKSKKDRAMEIDHVFPVCYGGNNSLENLVLSCFDCNMTAKGIPFYTYEEKKDYILTKREILSD